MHKYYIITQNNVIKMKENETPIIKRTATEL